MKLMYFGPFWPGSTALQRLLAFKEIKSIETIGIDNGALIQKAGSILNRIRWKLRLPADVLGENDAILSAVMTHTPNIVIVDNSKVITKVTLKKMKSLGVQKVIYYTPDDIMGRHNLSLPLKWSLPYWDLIFTTKTFNIPELLEVGANPFLIGKSYDSKLHKPMTREQVGSDYESFDIVFLGTYESERCKSINALAKAGFSIVVYGADKGNWSSGKLDSSVTLRNSKFGDDYVNAWHTGKVALCFLRKLNRDLITQRTMEIAAIGRPMLAEKTVEHDSHFLDGSEYYGFSTDEELVDKVKYLLEHDDERNQLGRNARQRCLLSGYSTLDRAMQMVEAIKNV